MFSLILIESLCLAIFYFLPFFLNFLWLISASLFLVSTVGEVQVQNSIFARVAKISKPLRNSQAACKISQDHCSLYDNHFCTVTGAEL